MKKILAVSLALLMLLAFVACSDVPAETDPETPITPGTDTEPTVTESDKSTETETEPGTETEPVETDPVTPPTDNTFVDCDDTVYVNGTLRGLNIRTTPAVQDGNLVATLKMGTPLKRIGHNGSWSKIEYEGKICYASSTYLSTKAPVTFTDVNETVYVVVEKTVSLREVAWAEAEELEFLGNGIALSRTGVSTEADEFGSMWSRVKYTNDKGETIEGYVNSRFLTTEQPLSFTDTDETVVVYNCVQLHLRAQPSRKYGNSLKTVLPGTELQRIGIAKKADDEQIVWSMVICEGQVCYASSACLMLKSDMETGETETESTPPETVAPSETAAVTE